MNQSGEQSSKQTIPGSPRFINDKIKNRGSWLAWNFGPPLILIIVVLLFFPQRGTFEFSSDEAVNLMKVSLVSRGHSLYSEIWSDQPPLFTQALASAFPYLGYDIGDYRFLVLLLSALLLWAAFQFNKIVWGKWHGLITVILIFLLPQFMVLSVSVMIGLPAIAFAMLSLLMLAAWHKHQNILWLFLSAIALGISISIKLFTGFLAPIFLVGLVLAAYRNTDKNRSVLSMGKVLLPAVFWGCVFGAFTIGVAYFLVGFDNIPQLIENHLQASDVEYFQSEAFTINWHLNRVWPLILLAVIGTIFSIRQKRLLALYPFAWMVASYILLRMNAPVWDHQQLLVTVPAALLSAIAVYEAIRIAYPAIRNYVRSISPRTTLSGWLFAVAIFGLFFLVFTIRVPEPFSLLSWRPSLRHSGLGLKHIEESFLNELDDYAPQTSWVVTDMLMYAFRNRLLVPPNTAVFTSKRWETGNLTQNELIDTIREYKPEQVFFGKRSYPKVERYLEDDYQLVLEFGDMKLFVLKDIVHNE